jgi:hypothetical protein
MHDLFLILTPLLLFAIVALLGFAGCYVPVTLASAGVTHVATVVNSNGANTNSITSDPLTLAGGEFLVAVVQWSSAISGPDMPAFSPPIFTPLAGIAPFAWNNMTIQVFTAQNPDGNSTQLKLTATLLRNSNIPWNLCVSAYDGVAGSPESPENSPLNSVGNPTTPTFSINPGDLVYAVALAADSDGTFPGSNKLSAGPEYVSEFPSVTNPLVEDGAPTGTNGVVAQATNSNPDPNAKGFIFSMVLKTAS